MSAAIVPVLLGVAALAEREAEPDLEAACAAALADRDPAALERLASTTLFELERARARHLAS